MTDKPILVSPSMLKWDMKCERCAWLKLKRDIRQPSLGFPSLFNTIHERIYDFLRDRHTSEVSPDMPQGRLVETEQKVQSVSKASGVTLHGRIDGLLELDGGGYAIIDLKTTDKTDRLAANYSLQLNIYRLCMEYPAPDAFSVKPITRLGLLAFSPDTFQQGRERVGLSGTMEWIEVEIDDSIVGKAVGDVVMLLKHDEPPPSSLKCDWCAYARARDNVH